MSSMSAAAKAIVIIDAVGAKEKEQEKSSNSGFKKIFSKNREKGQCCAIYLTIYRLIDDRVEGVSSC